MRRSWAMLHKGVRQGRSVLELLPPLWGCPMLRSPKQSFCWPKQVEWMNKGSQSDSLPPSVSTYKAALKPVRLNGCSFALVEWRRWTTSSCSTQAAPRQEVAQLQLSPMVRDTQKPLQKGWLSSQLCLESAYVTDCSQTKGNASPVEATLSSSFGVMPRYVKVPSLNSPSLMQW